VHIKNWSPDETQHVAVKQRKSSYCSPLQPPAIVRHRNTNFSAKWAVTCNTSWNSSK